MSKEVSLRQPLNSKCFGCPRKIQTQLRENTTQEALCSGIWDTHMCFIISCVMFHRYFTVTPLCSLQFIPVSLKRIFRDREIKPFACTLNHCVYCLLMRGYTSWCVGENDLELYPNPETSITLKFHWVKSMYRTEALKW